MQSSLVPFISAVVPTVEEPDDRVSVLSSLTKARQLSADEERYLAAQQSQYASFIISRMNYVHSIYESVGNLSKAWNAFIPNSNAEFQALQTNTQTAMNQLATIGTMLTTAQTAEATRDQRQLAMASQMDSFSTAITAVQTGLTSWSKNVNEQFSKLSASNAAYYEEQQRQLTVYQTDAKQISGTMEQTKALIASSNSEIAKLSAEMARNEAAFKEAMTLYLAQQKNILTTEESKKQQKTMIRMLKASFQESQQEMALKIQTLQQGSEQYQLSLNTLVETMKKTQEDFSKLEGVVTNTEATTKTLNDTVKVNEDLTKGFTALKENVVQLIDKVSEDREGQQLDMVPYVESLEALKTTVATSLTEVTNTINLTKNEIISIKNDYNTVLQKIVNISTEITNVTNTMNNVYAVVQLPAPIVAAASPAPPPAPAIDYGKLGEAVALSLDQRLTALEARDETLQRLATAIDVRYKAITDAADRQNKVTLDLVSQQIRRTLSGLKTNLSNLLDTKMRAVPDQAAFRNNPALFTSYIEKPVKLTYFVPFTLDLMNRPGPRDLIDGERPRLGQASAKGRPNKKHGLVQVRSREPDPFVDPMYHVRKVRTQRARKTAKATVRRRKLGHSKRSDYLF